MAPLVVVLVVALGCMGLSLRRLLFVFDAPFADAEALLKALRAAKKRGVTLLEARLPDGSFESMVQEAIAAPADIRVARLGEALMELEFSLAHWARVPRVCASITSSVGFLGAAVFLRRGLLEEVDGDAPDFNGLVLSAIGVAAVGIAGAITCALLHRAAMREAKQRMRGADDLVEWLETYGIDAGEGEPAQLDYTGAPEGTGDPGEPVTAVANAGVD